MTNNDLKFKRNPESFFANKIESFVKNLGNASKTALIDITSNLLDDINILISNLKKVDFETFFEEIRKETKTTSKNAIKILEKYNWPITENLPYAIYNNVIVAVNNGETEQSYIDDIFINFLSSQDYLYLRNKIVSKWKQNKLFTARMEIFNHCITVLSYSNEELNPSNVVIPTLISQTDGILSDFLGKQLRKGWKEEFKRKINNYEYSSILNQVLVDVLFETSFYKSKIKSPLNINRHKIMHGEDINYGTVANSLRLFLILDHLSLVL